MTLAWLGCVPRCYVLRARCSKAHGGGSGLEAKGFGCNTRSAGLGTEARRAERRSRRDARSVVCVRCDLQVLVLLRCGCSASALPLLSS